jgi:hypothetical protein
MMIKDHKLETKIREAVARGWCHPETEDRVMDADLAEAIVGEIMNLAQPLYGRIQLIYGSDG